jgi:electron transport complex, RnfABCDGE type, C subunit
VLKTFSKGGVHPPEEKMSASAAISVLPIPSEVFVPFSQHIGAPSEPVVAIGDKVKVGDIIAKSTSFVSANIHSSVSGTVAGIEYIVDASGYPRQAFRISVEGDEWRPEIDRSSAFVKGNGYDAKQILEIIQSSGIVGLGGATFPSHVKLVVPHGKKADALIINGAECEPYLTADHRLMLEKGHEILEGTRLLMITLGVTTGYIAIENNKPDAIAHLKTLVKNYEGIEIVPLKVKYPQGGEKQLIKSIIGREVPSGGLPIDIGAVVQNVATAYAVYEAVVKHKPLFERVVTVTGKSVKNPRNFMVRVGTPVSCLIDAIGGLPEDTGKIISGGPMMGKALNSVNSPVAKGTSGILLVPEKLSRRSQEAVCIRCSKCVSVCPMGLEPYLLFKLGKRGFYDRMEVEHVLDCMECGSCSFTCPAKLPLLDYIRLGKGAVAKMIKNRKK